MSPRRYWQVGSGRPDRPYADHFLQHWIALIGPGDPGPWTPEAGDAMFAGAFVRWFATRPEDRDVMLLREGRSRLRAVGVVRGPYAHWPQFDDVNGWDLQHGRRVRWHDPGNPHDFGQPVFQPNRFSAVHEGSVREFADAVLQDLDEDWASSPLPDLPIEEPLLDAVPDDLVEAVTRVNEHLQFYWNNGVQPSERETVAHCVLPFLEALGWSRTSLALEWSRTDVAAFIGLPREMQNLRLIVEAKTLGKGFQLARRQAFDYAQKLGADVDVVLTDGARYRVYRPPDFDTSVAYANLSRLRQSAVNLFARLRPAQM